MGLTSFGVRNCIYYLTLNSANLYFKSCNIWLLALSFVKPHFYWIVFILPLRVVFYYFTFYVYIFLLLLFLVFTASCVCWLEYSTHFTKIRPKDPMSLHGFYNDNYFVICFGIIKTTTYSSPSIFRMVDSYYHNLFLLQ